MLRRLARLPNYIRAFGPAAGLRLDLAIERALPHQSDIVREFRVPGLSSPISLRDSVADHSIFWQCIVQHQYDLTGLPHHAALMVHYRALLAGGTTPLIVDAGGNIGLSAIALAEAWPQARILVVEPDAGNFELLRRNTIHFGGRVTPLLGAIWSRDQRLSIANPDAGASAFRVESSDEGGLQAYTMESLMRLAGADRIFLAKIDIEGAQSTLFAENTSWIADTDAIVIELEDWLFPWQGNSQSFMRAIAGYDFEYLLLGDSLACFSTGIGAPAQLG